MKRKLSRLVLPGLSLVALSAIFVTSMNDQKLENSQEMDEVTSLRSQHEAYLMNSPFKETKHLTKKERKAEGLPPNRYYEQLWDLSINPRTGRTEPEKIYEVRELLKSGRAKSAPGDDVNNPWIERGPNDIGGRTRAILFDPNDANNRRVFAGGVSGGLWVNDNITSTASQWSRVAGVPGNLSVTTLTVDPRNSNIMYIGTGEQYTGGDVVGNGVYRSTDGGTTWQALNVPAAGGGDIVFNANELFLSGVYFVNDFLAWNNTAQNRTDLFIAVGAHSYGDASGPNNRLGLQSAGLYRSIDNGATWTRIESANMRYVREGVNYYYIPNDFEVTADNRLWMGTIGSLFGEGGGRVYSSLDGGTWTEAAASPLNDSNRVELEASTTDANKLYALTQGSTEPVHIYRTTNQFGSTTATALPNDVDTGIPANDFTRGQSFYDLMIEADPTNDDIIYVGGIDLFRSNNSGNSWSQISKWSNNNNLRNLRSSLVHADQHAMVFRPGNSNQALFGNDGGIFYANGLSSASNSNVISARNNNFNVTQYVKAGIGPNGVGDLTGIFTAGAQDNGSQAFRNAGAGINGSEPLSDGDGFYTFVDKDGQYMTATFTNNVIYRFSLPWDGRGRAQGGATTLVNEGSTGDFVNPMGYDSEANFMLTNSTPSRTTNYQIKTIDVAGNRQSDITNALLTGSPTAFIASPFANGTWFVGTANGKLLRLTNVRRGGATWAEINTPFVGSVSSVRLGATANDLMVTIHNYGVTSVWASSDAGANWVNKEGDLPDIPVRDLLQNPLDRTEVIVATQLGVWVTKDFNAANPTWVQSQNGMSDASVTSFDYWAKNGNDNDNIIIASTYGRGVFTGSFGPNGNTVDTEAPTVPTNLVASNVAQTSVRLNWNASNDNVGVTGYDVLQDGVMITTVTTTNYNVSGLTAGTAYTFTVRANDAANNQSGLSNVVNVTTTTATADPCNGGVTLTADSGSFADGSGTNNYIDNRNCTWLIRPTNGGRVTLNFDNFNTEANFDFVTVFDGENAAATQLGNFSGTSIPSEITSTGNALFVRFTSDGSVTRAGWAASYTSVTQTGGGVTGCTSGITSFPYNEGFEGNFGAWTQGAGNDFDWIRQSGGTRSRDTGPTSAVEGSFYVYVEASSPNNPNRVTTINSPCFNLSGETVANFTFRYHMRGSAVGNLKLEASNNDGASWTEIWSESGNQGSSWLNANVNLNAYTGNSVQLRFVGTTGTSWRGDMAVDDIALTVGSSTTSTTEDSLSNLTDTGAALEFSLYPNPVSGNVLNVASTTTSKMSFKIMNMIGQVVREGAVIDHKINVNGLSQGSYVIEIGTENEEAIIKRFIKR